MTVGSWNNSRFSHKELHICDKWEHICDTWFTIVSTQVDGGAA